MLYGFYRVMAFAIGLSMLLGHESFLLGSYPAYAQSFSETGSDLNNDANGVAICMGSDELHIDPGYCAGLSMAYLETLGNNNVLAMIAETDAIDQLRGIQKQCHATSFDSTFGLGQAAFHRMLHYASPDRLNARLVQCLGMLRYYRLSWPGDGGRGKD